MLFTNRNQKLKEAIRRKNKGAQIGSRLICLTLFLDNARICNVVVENGSNINSGTHTISLFVASSAVFGRIV